VLWTPQQGMFFVPLCQLTRPANAQRSRPARISCICLYAHQSIYRYIHFAVPIGEGRLVRSPVNFDRHLGFVGKRRTLFAEVAAEANSLQSKAKQR
jgi:hypothetical protein